MMVYRFLTIITVLCAVSIAQGGPPRLYTRPSVPLQNTVNPIGLHRHWHTYLPMQGKRDRIVSAQALGSQLVFQTTSGWLTSIDADTGVTQWRVRVGEAFRSQLQPVAANSTIYAVPTDTEMRGLDRTNGRELWKMQLPGILAARPTMDDHVLLLTTNRASSFAFTLPGAEIRAEELGSTTIDTLRTNDFKSPVQDWFVQREIVNSRPIVPVGPFVVTANERGVVRSYHKFKKSLIDQYTCDSPPSAPLGRNGSIVFIPSEDSQLYALDVQFDRLALRWKSIIGSPIILKPATIGNELFVSSLATGLFSLNNESGERIWNQERADRFLAASKRLVFASDPRGRILVLDRSTGAVMGRFNTTAYSHLISNEHTDRLYIANNDGLIVCLRDISKEYANPLVYEEKPMEAQVDDAAPVGDGDAEEKR